MATHDRSGHRALLDGAKVCPARVAKSAGAGSIYLRTKRPEALAKRYHPSIDCAEYGDRIAAMLKPRPKLAPLFNGKEQVQIAWPTAPVLDSGRWFIGLAMLLLDIDATWSCYPAISNKSLPVPCLSSRLTLDDA